MRRCCPPPTPPASGRGDKWRLSAISPLFVTRPTLFDYYSDPAERQAGADYVFDMFRQGVISANIGQTYALEDAAQAHRDLEAGKTVGATILRP